MEFKGTKGDIEIRGNKLFIKDTFNSLATIHVQKNYKDVTFEPIEDVEAKANILLFSKAPQLLESLENAIKLLEATTEFDVLIWYKNEVEKLKELVKQSTELK